MMGDTLLTRLLSKQTREEKQPPTFILITDLAPVHSHRSTLNTLLCNR